MHRVFISDLHLDDPASLAYLRFCECLALESTRADEIYVLGDLVEMWVGDDDDSETATRLTDVLSSATAVCTVRLMHGNRDFLIGDRFANQTGVEIINDPFVLDGHVALSHGDALCTDDAEYQALRKTMRDPVWQKEILGKSLDERKAFGHALRQQSKASSANKPTNIMDVNAQAVRELMEETSTDLLVHGHTHRPGYHAGRIVTGAWDRCGWLCRERDGRFRLEAFPLATCYVGIPL